MRIFVNQYIEQYFQIHFFLEGNISHDVLWMHVWSAYLMLFYMTWITNNVKAFHFICNVS